MEMTPLVTPRLTIRPFTLDDLDDIHRILDVELADARLWSALALRARTREECTQWLQWTIMSYEQLAKLYQPPYGDRAMALKHTGQLVGACGYVPCLAPFGQLPGFASATGDPAPGVQASRQPHRPGGQDARAPGDDPAPCVYSTEFGLFYAVAPAYQRQGYATEAASALIEHAFEHLRLKRVVAMTRYENLASIGVMRNLGMRIEKNPYPDPPWLQVVGVIENRATSVGSVARTPEVTA
jgi:RimJ/RimL family protein N-acetyltransferase